jgi:MFS family permease
VADVSPVIEEAALAAQSSSGGVGLDPRQRYTLLFAAGCVLLLIEFAAPSGGLIGLPITFFLKNRLHMPAAGVAGFNLWASVPLYISFLFGFLRDRWSPFGRGDRAYLVIFGGLTAAGFGAMAFIPPTYATLMGGVLLVSMGVLTAGAAARGISAAIGQENAVTGMAGSIANLAALIPGMVAFGLGGFLSQAMEGQSAPAAARTLFLVGAALMLGVVAFGLLGPKRLLDTHRPQDNVTHSAWDDVKRLLRHWPIYPVLLIYMIWQFGPASGTALQYHLANDLHATDAQVGLWSAFFAFGFLPVIAAYAWLCRKVKLNWLLWIGTVLAVPQFAPFLFIHTVNDALVAGVVMGLVGGLAQAAYTDLAIRSCPPGLQGTMMMFLIAGYWVPFRFGDLWGSYLYEHAGGFRTATLATIAVYALILPLLLFVPRRLTSTVDGEIVPAAA